MYGAPPPPQGRGRGLLPNVPPYQQPVAAHPHYPPPPPSSYNPPFNAAYRPIAGPAPAPHLGAPVKFAPPPPGIGGRPGSSSSGFSGASSVHSGSSAGHFVGGFHSPAPGPVGPPVVVAPRNASFSGPSGYPPGQAPGTPIHLGQLPYAGSPSLQVAPPPRSPSAPPYNPVTPPTAHTATMGPVMTQGRPSPAQAHGFGYSPGQFVTPPRGPTSSQGHGRHSSSDLGHGVPSSVSMPGHGRFGSFSGGPDSRVPSGVYASPASMPNQMQGRRASEGGASAGGGHGGPRDTSHLTLTLPDVPRLEDDRGRALASGDPRRQLRWATDVVKFVERKGDAARPTEPPLVQFIDEAIGIVSPNSASPWSVCVLLGKNSHITKHRSMDRPVERIPLPKRCTSVETCKLRAPSRATCARTCARHSTTLSSRRGWAGRPAGSASDGTTKCSETSRAPRLPTSMALRPVMSDLFM